MSDMRRAHGDILRIRRAFRPALTPSVIVISHCQSVCYGVYGKWMQLRTGTCCYSDSRCNSKPRSTTNAPPHRPAGRVLRGDVSCRRDQALRRVPIARATRPCRPGLGRCRRPPDARDVTGARCRTGGSFAVRRAATGQCPGEAEQEVTRIERKRPSHAEIERRRCARAAAFVVGDRRLRRGPLAVLERRPGQAGHHDVRGEGHDTRFARLRPGPASASRPSTTTARSGASSHYPSSCCSRSTA